MTKKSGCKLSSEFLQRCLYVAEGFAAYNTESTFIGARDACQEGKNFQENLTV